MEDNYPYFNWRSPGGFQEYIFNIVGSHILTRGKGISIEEMQCLSAGPYSQMTSDHYRLIRAEP
jgi:hypothetical protein